MPRSLASIVVLALGCAHTPPPAVAVCPEPDPVAEPEERTPPPLPAPSASVAELTAEVVAMEVVAARPFSEIGSFPGMKLAIHVRSTGRGIVSLAPDRSVIRSVKDDRGTVLFDERGPHGPVGMHPGLSASTSFDQGPTRIGIDLRVPAPTTGAREVTIDADLAVMVGGEPETIETPLHVAVGETFALGGVAFSVARIGPSRHDGAAVELTLRATDESIAKALLDSLEVVTDAGPVRVVRRGWMTSHRPEEYTELELHLASEVEDVTLRGRLPSDLELVMLPFQVRVGIGSVVQPPSGS